MKNTPKLVRSYELLYSQSYHHFLLENGVFIVLAHKSSVGFFVHQNDINDERIQTTVRMALNHLQTTHLNEIKIIGTAPLCQKVEPALKIFGSTKLVLKEGRYEVLFDAKENRTRLAPTIPQKNTNPVDENLPRSLDLKNKIKVLIVDDSKTIRTLLKKIFAQNSQITIVADTGNPLEVIKLIEEAKPDVITLDIHMPEMDGLTLLKKYIGKYPIPTVMITSISMEEGPTVLNALEAGAVDYIKKPELNELAEASDLIIDKIISASTAHVTSENAKQKSTPSIFRASALDTNSIIAIGASTGGTEALRVVLTQLPPEIPPILIVQHIPAGFSKAFAKRIDSLCPFEVLEAENHHEIRKNRVLIAPGGKQMRAVCRGNKWYVTIDDSPPVNRHKPSVDFLFDSLCEYEFKKPVGVILTGMGNDGAKGLLNLKNRGWTTIAQDKDSCVVFGMPAVAIELGAAQHVCPLDSIAEKIQHLIPAKKIA